MIIAETRDSNIITDFMTKDEVWETFTDDMSEKDQYIPDLSSKSLWLTVSCECGLVGIVSIENENLNTLRIHPCLLKKHRTKIREVFNLLFKMILNTPYFINKVVVSIPFSRRIVYNTAKKIGFKDEGVNRESFLKDGVFHDQWNLGLTKKEIKGLIWEI